MTTQTLAPPRAAAILAPAGLLAVLLGAALPLIDFFIVNVALPTIGSDLHTSPASLELVVAGYGIAYAASLVLGGRLGDAFGRRRLFLIGLALFTVTSLLCGLAPDAGTLVIARIAQGMSAALMQPQGMSIIQATTTGEHRARALSLWGATAGLSMLVGQLLGGVLVAADIGGLSWRPIFLVNVPIGIVGLLVARRSLPESRSSYPLGVDRIGTVLFGVTLLALLIPLTEGAALGWPWWSWLLLAVVPAGVVLFVRAQRRLERACGAVPLLPPSILRIPSMRRGLLVNAPFFAGFSGFMFVYAVTTQDGLHLGPLGSGLAIAPFAVAFFLVSLVTPRLVGRYGARIAVAGAAVQLLGLLTSIAVVAFGWEGLGVARLAPGMVLLGVGQAMLVNTLFRLVLSNVPADRAGVGSGVLATTQQTAMAVGVAVLGTLFTTLTGAHGMQSAFVTTVGVQAAVTVGVLLGARALPDPRG